MSEYASDAAEASQAVTNGKLTRTAIPRNVSQSLASRHTQAFPLIFPDAAGVDMNLDGPDPRNSAYTARRSFCERLLLFYLPLFHLLLFHLHLFGVRLREHGTRLHESC